MGTVVLEAMASGCPVVAPRAGGIPSLVEEGRTGLLYAPGDLEDAVRATRAVLDGAAFRHRLGGAVRAAVETRDWKHSIGRVREVYREAIRAFGPAPSRPTPGQCLAWAVASSLVFAFRALSRDHPAAAQGAVVNGPAPKVLASVN